MLTGTGLGRPRGGGEPCGTAGLDDHFQPVSRNQHRAGDFGLADQLDVVDETS